MAEGLDFNSQMTQLIGEMARSVDEFRQFDARQIRVSASFNRSRNRGGVLAYVVPLRYRDGLPVELRRHGSRLYHWAMLPQRQDLVRDPLHGHLRAVRYLGDAGPGP